VKQAATLTKRLNLDEIKLEPKLMVRADLDDDAINEFADAMAVGAKFPPVDVFGIDGGYFLVDGWHRYHAAERIADNMIAAKIHQGTAKDALAFALKANQAHGVRRSNADKRKAVMLALAEWPDLSSRALADVCGVSDVFVGEVRKQVQTDCTSSRKGKDGKAYPASQPELCAKCQHPRSEHSHDGECSHLLTPGKPQSQCACMQFLSRQEAHRQIDGLKNAWSDADKDAAESSDADLAQSPADQYREMLSRDAWIDFENATKGIAHDLATMESLTVPLAHRPLALAACSKLLKRMAEIVKRFEGVDEDAPQRPHIGELVVNGTAYRGPFPPPSGSGLWKITGNLPSTKKGTSGAACGKSWQTWKSFSNEAEANAAWADLMAHQDAE
jgi:hypothetical protein